MRRDRADQMVAFDGRLPGDTQLPCRDVAKATVRELARRTAGSRCEVVAFDERDRQSAARCVESDTGAGDAATDHEDVDNPTGAQRAQVTIATLPGQHRV